MADKVDLAKLSREKNAAIRIRTLSKKHPQVKKFLAENEELKAQVEALSAELAAMKDLYGDGSDSTDQAKVATKKIATKKTTSK